MLIIKRLFISFIIIIFFINFNLISFANEEDSLHLNCRSCIVIDRTSKKILFGKNEYTKSKMASTTKIMTAIIILENCDLNKVVTVSNKSASTGGSRLGLKINDKISIKDLLYALLLVSGNDAAVCLAETCSGSIYEFANLMNKKAKELNLNNTHFESPHGLDSDNHYTTAYELALLTDYALNNTYFREIVSTKNYTLTINGHSKNISNTNELLGTLDGIYGVKTGFTNGANRCLVTACKRGNMDIICVVLGCDTKHFRASDSTKLITYCFENFEYVNIEDLILSEFKEWINQNSILLQIDKGKINTLEINLSKISTPIFPIRKDEISSLKVNFSVNKLSAPIYKDSFVGEFLLSSKSGNILNGQLIANKTINRKSPFDYLKNFFKMYQAILNNIPCSFFEKK